MSETVKEVVVIVFCALWRVVKALIGLEGGDGSNGTSA